MKPRIHLFLSIPAVAMLALLTATPLWAQSLSHARIVRLSFVEGNVTVQRPDVQGWAEAPVNTPLQQGFTLSTGAGSFAEIQFENGGAIRLGEQSLMEFTELARDPSGSTIDRVELRQGYATFHPLPSRLGEFLQVGTPLGKLTAQGGTEFRVDLEQGMERVEVMNGSVDEQSNLGSMTIEQDSVLVMQPGAPHPTTVSQGITEDDWDQWVADREAHAEMAASGPSPDAYTGDADEPPYGWDDLAQHGKWTDVQGEGYGWIPYAAAGWAPYSSGQWCWYPGWGYTWIGSEPWGWLPYHFGSWEFIPGMGWVWFPGSLRTWSPGQVVWYQGPNWVGWIPRPHHKGGTVACTSVCGGGVVSTATLRSGGLLTPGRLLRINPTTGTTVNAPGISPSTAAMLPGTAVALPAAQSHGFQVNTAQPQVGLGVSGAVTVAPGLQRTGRTNPNSSIVFDPQQGAYINGRRPARPPVQPAFPASPAGANTVTTPAANPGSIQPVPVEGRPPTAGPVEGPGVVRQSPGVYASPAPMLSTPASNSTGARPSGGAVQAGTTHGGAWAPAESHASPPPAGGGHSAPPAPSGGGATGGHH